MIDVAQRGDWSLVVVSQSPQHGEVLLPLLTNFLHELHVAVVRRRVARAWGIIRTELDAKEGSTGPAGSR